MDESVSSSGHISHTPGGDGWEALSTLAPSQQWPHATSLFNQGLPAADLYLIEHGLVKLVHVSADGKEVIVGLRSSGKVLGGPSVILGEAYPVSAVTLTPCSLHRIPAPVLRRALKTNAVVADYLLRQASREVLEQLSQIIDSGLPAPRRLKKLLAKLARDISETHWPEGARVPLLLKHWEIAQMIAVTPQHLSRLLKDIKDKDSVRIQKGWLMIPDPSRFARDA